MCKIFVLTNMNKIKKVDNTINTIMNNLAYYEKDGLGYTIQGSDGIFGERSTDTKNFSTSFEQPMLTLPFLEQSYNRFGVKSEIIGGGIFHGRTSTNHKNITNTHPINKHGWSLIHNGVVTNHGPEYKQHTTNDSEHLVELIGTVGIKGIERYLTGYYAAAAFSPDNKLHIFRDSIATLYFCHIQSIDSYAIATTMDLLQDTLAELKLKHSKISAIKDNQYIVLNKNIIESVQTIKPKGRTAYESKYSELSLGRKLDITEHISQEMTLLSLVENDSTYTESQLLFIEEIKNYADHTYTFLDFRGNALTLADFNALELDEKFICTVIRSDGTVVNAYDYHTDRIYMG